MNTLALMRHQKLFYYSEHFPEKKMNHLISALLYQAAINCAETLGDIMGT